MIHRSTIIPLYIGFACAPEGNESSFDLNQKYDVIQATVSMDYAIGTLSTINRDDDSMYEDISAISGDPALSYDGRYLWQFNRYRYDTLRKYDPQNLSYPIQEISLQDESNASSNPQDVVQCAGKIFVSQHDRTEILILDPESMSNIGEISLLDFIDEDGSPEAASIITTDNQQLYVGLQRLNRNNGWNSDGSVIVHIDCEEEIIRNHISFGADIRLYQEQEKIWVSTSPIADQKGGLFVLNEDLSLEQHIELEDKKILDVTSHQENMFFITLDNDLGQQELFCLEKDDGALVSVQHFEEYLTFITSDMNAIWFGAHWGWNNPAEAKYGTHIWSFEGCAVQEKKHLFGDLAPVDMVFLQ